MTETISAYFQCHKNPYATYESLRRFREFYPTEQIVLLSDNGYDYTEMAKHFNCTYIHETTSCKHSVSNPTKYYLTVERIRNIFSMLSSEYVLFLEDDVHVYARYPNNSKVTSMETVLIKFEQVF